MYVQKPAGFYEKLETLILSGDSLHIAIAGHVVGITDNPGQLRHHPRAGRRHILVA
jgi:hypothetical protein